MSRRISFSTQSPMGQLAAEAVDQILEGRAKINRIYDSLHLMVDDTDENPEYSGLEEEFGLKPGTAARFFEIFDSAKKALDDQRIAALSAVDQA